MCRRSGPLRILEMMTLREQLSQDLISAMKSKDAEKVSTLRFLISAIKYKEVDKKSELTDAEVVEAISKQVKTHKESIEAFKKGNRPDLVTKEESELKILQSYLPVQMGEGEVRERVAEKLEELRNQGQAVDFGTLMKLSMFDLKGKAEGSMVKTVVEKVLKEG